MDFGPVYDGLKAAQTWQFPLHLAKVACRLGSNIGPIKHFSKQAKKRLHWASGPLQGVTFTVYGVDLALASGGLKAVRIGLTVLKKGSEIVQWVDWARLVQVDLFWIEQATEVRLAAGFAKASFRLWKDLHAEPEKRNLLVSIPKFLKSSLLVIYYITDNKIVKVAVKILGFIQDGLMAYRLYQTHCWTWNIDVPKACKAITLIVISFWVLEINVDFDSIN